MRGVFSLGIHGLFKAQVYNEQAYLKSLTAAYLSPPCVMILLYRQSML